MSTAAPLADPICTHNVPLPTPEQLPNDLETLKRMLIEVMVTLHQERREKEQLQQRMKLLLQRLYGPRSERCNPDQGFLFAEATDSADHVHFFGVLDGRGDPLEPADRAQANVQIEQ